MATISACLFLFGLFYAVITNFQSIVKSAEEGVSVTIFFQPGTTEEQIMDIGSKIEARDEVSKIEYTSPEQAWEYYKVKLDTGRGFQTDSRIILWRIPLATLSI